MSAEIINGTIPLEASNKVMVLLIDDQALVGEVVRRILLRAEDIDFHFCSDATKALSTALAIRPTVILQDLLMPGVDGLDLVRGYKGSEELKDLPIIVLSAKDDATIKSQAFEAGANDYLVKLPDAIELIARIRYHSKAYIAMRQRDEMYKALRTSQQQLQETNLVLEKLLRADGLTGLANRRHFDEYLDIEWKRAARDQLSLALLMLDVDYFKAFNDAYGHVEGDHALRKVAQVINIHCERAGDVGARYGGEEFVIVLPNTVMSGACQLAEKIRRGVEAHAIPHQLPAAGAVVTVSVGVACIIPTPEQLPVRLIELADKALYQAKHNGKNRYIACTDDNTRL